MKNWEKPYVNNLAMGMTQDNSDHNNGNKNHGCELCHECFQSNSDFEEHMKTAHKELYDKHTYKNYKKMNALYCRS